MEIGRFNHGIVAAVLLAGCVPVQAHPVPFSYVDVRVQPNAIGITVVAHIFDIGHDLDVQPPERLLDPATLDAYSTAIAGLLRGRLQLAADGTALTEGAWAKPEGVPDRQSIRLQVRYRLERPLGSVDVTTVMFPYDPQHRTFLNFYEDGAITAQAILDKNRTRFEYFAGTRQGVWAVLQKFIPAGVHHILIGPDHLMFLVGLLLMGGTIRQLLSGRDRVYHSSQHYVVAGGAPDGHSAGGRHRTGDSAQRRSMSAPTTCS